MLLGDVRLCRKHGISGARFYNWKARYGGLDVSDARRLKTLEDENRKLKKLLAEVMLDTVGLKELLAGTGDARRQARGGRSSPGEAGGERAAGVQDDRALPDDGALPIAPAR